MLEPIITNNVIRVNKVGLRPGSPRVPTLRGEYAESAAAALAVAADDGPEIVKPEELLEGVHGLDVDHGELAVHVVVVLARLLPQFVQNAESSPPRPAGVARIALEVRSGCAAQAFQDATMGTFSSVLTRCGRHGIVHRATELPPGSLHPEIALGTP